MHSSAAAASSAVSSDHTRQVLEKEKRLPELDSIRGLAALTVVLQHFHDLWMPDDPAAVPRALQVVLPALKPFYSGSEAVMLFFVLSGFVLALPMLRGKHVPYPRFALRRILRIAGPYYVAITLAILGAALFYSHPGHRNGWSAGIWSRFPDAALVLQHYLFLGVYNTGEFDTVIWSLLHELRISLVFPFLFVLVRRMGIAGSVVYAAAATSAAAWMYSHPVPALLVTLLQSLHYSGFFVVGILLATHRERLNHAWQGLSPAARALFAVASVLCFAYSARIVGLLLTAFDHRTVVALTPAELQLANWLCGFSACGFIVMATSAASLRRFLLTRACHTLGRISYSLYLVHVIILLTLTSLLGESVSLWIQLPVYVALALGAGWLFCRWVEEPVIRLARSV